MISSTLRRIRTAVEPDMDGWHEPLLRPDRPTDALGDRPNAVEVNEPPGSAWVDATGEVDGPTYSLNVTQMRVFVEDGRLVALFRPDGGPTDEPPAPDLGSSLFVDTDGDSNADVAMRTTADGEAWAAAVYRLDPLGNGTLAAEDLRPVVNAYGVGTSADLDVLGPKADLSFVGQAATEGAFDGIPMAPMRGCLFS